jgi:hypothetical protein
MKTNGVHNKAIPLILRTEAFAVPVASLIRTSEPALGFGLKLQAGFRFTHLTVIPELTESRKA